MDISESCLIDFEIWNNTLFEDRTDDLVKIAVDKARQKLMKTLSVKIPGKLPRRCNMKVTVEMVFEEGGWNGNGQGSDST